MVLHGTFNGPVDLSQVRFEDFAHLRDAEFGSDVCLRDAAFEFQAFLHESTIEGAIDARNATFEHFQFAATVSGDVDFSGARFGMRGLFARTEIDGTALFDDASFAGNPDFSDSRFKDRVLFANTEFLVEPSFDGTQFAVDPDLDAATYPQYSSTDLSYRRQNIVVVREKLQNAGETLSVDVLTGDVVIPVSATGLLNPSTDLQKQSRRHFERLSTLTGTAYSIDRSNSLVRQRPNSETTCTRDSCLGSRSINPRTMPPRLLTPRDSLVRFD
ncbi:pentapeptide repeat-containing protein [Halosolutus amylolyticus]|uniref:Pentapeptide repeat-containing protein n=1 Tax=Halosolutus amylolyticus TaxID=2932267 RepID=A0ABD5PJ58_9EURY|nr:pentapeptide repeat-containing protein [Halosolutus amylolyticus]